MLQPDPRSGEGCNTLLHEGFAEKIVISSLLYTFLSSASVYDTIKEQRFEISGRGL